MVSRRPELDHFFQYYAEFFLFILNSLDVPAVWDDFFFSV